MRVHIDTQKAKETVESLRKTSRLLMQDCETMLKNVQGIGRGMQTQMSDTVRNESTKVERDISHLRSEMQKLEDYTAELSRYIENYNQCAYRGSVGSSYANVSTEEVYSYWNLTEGVAKSVTAFRQTFEEEYSQIVSQLDSGIFRLDQNHAEADGALSSLIEKIDRARARLEELGQKRRELEEKLRNLLALLAQEEAAAEEARRSAAAVYVPPYRSWTVTDENGNEKKMDNQEEINRALAIKNAYLNQAAHHDSEAARLRAQIEQVKKELNETIQRINEIQELLQQMQQTEGALRAHLAELKRCRDQLYQAREELKSLHSSCMNSCQQMNQNCSTASQNLQNAHRSLQAYEVVALDAPHLIDPWRLF